MYIFCSFSDLGRLWGCFFFVANASFHVSAGPPSCPIRAVQPRLPRRSPVSPLQPLRLARRPESMASSTTQKLTAFLVNPVVRVAQATAILHCIKEYAFGITACAGPSMIPTFNESGDVIFAEMLSPRIGRLERGDVVIAVPPQNPKLRVCKRIIGLPGETVLVRSRSWFDDRPEPVPEGHVWLEGDNPSNSSDSRAYGPIPLAMVRGRVFFKAWPPSEIGRVRRRVPEAASAVVGRETASDGDSSGFRNERVRFMAAENAAENTRGRDQNTR